MDAHGTNTDAGKYQRNEERYSEIEFHLGPLWMHYWLILEIFFYSLNSLLSYVCWYAQLASQGSSIVALAGPCF